ncbi:MAG TPA: hypothetical protein VFQ24_12015 [Terriglobia bacterium]|nr:hypothetical protein [Terriglobia bacterium]
MRGRNRVAVTLGAILVPAVLATGAAASGQHQRVNQQSAIVADFQKRIESYMKLHKAAAGQLPALKSTASQAKILDYQHALAARIVAARPHATRGEIFTQPVAAEFRRLIRTTMTGSRAGRIRSSLQRGAPVKSNIEVNHPYPAATPVETTPPSLLLNLPKLPTELEYRVVNHDLVLHDVKADLVVDFVPEAVP